MKRQINFSTNLKHYRTHGGMTQRQLAEKIGYTEKSVSKWESGSGLPTVDILLQLCELFGVSLDDMVYEKISTGFILGIDGGGTKTAFLLTDENGAVINKLYKGPCNPNDIGMERAKALLKGGIAEICDGIPYSKITMFAGLSGGGLTGDNAQVLNSFFGKFGFYAYGNGSDIENLLALVQSKKCILVIMGTGFIVYAVDGEKRKRISGWGQFFDEGGSGYTIGRDAVTAALCSIDGSGEKTVLESMLEARIGEPVDKHVAAFYRGGKKYIAEFADIVFTAANDGDKTAFKILQKNMEFAAEKIRTAAAVLGTEGDPSPVPVLFSGGIANKSDILFPLLKGCLNGVSCTLSKIEGEPVEGALKMARRILCEKKERKC